MADVNNKTAYFHLPGLFEFFKFYRLFIPLFFEHREYFYDWCEIGSIYGSPNDCIWGGGRIEYSESDADEVLEMMDRYSISSRLTFSNSLLKEKHLSDKRCNELCVKLVNAGKTRNGVIVHSDLLMEYLRRNYPNLYLVSSTTKVLLNFNDFKKELGRNEFRYVVADFRLNRRFAELSLLSDNEKEKVEFLCNECCSFSCRDRKQCYESVSRKTLEDSVDNFTCTAPNRDEGYRFSSAMKNPAFISRDDIPNIYLPMGFKHFKIEGRGLGSALILEFILYYMTKPEYHIQVREHIYLSNTLDLF